MTVKELKEQLVDIPDDTLIVGEYDGCWYEATDVDLVNLAHWYDAKGQSRPTQTTALYIS